MFRKSSKASEAAAKVEVVSVQNVEPPRRGPKAASLIAEDLVIEGGVVGTDLDLHVDGSIRGDVRVARLTIGETGSIEGSITAETVDCRGRVTGSISAPQVRLFGAAHVEGDIIQEQLTMETGSFFQGRSLKFQPAQAAIAAVTSETTTAAAE